MVILQMPSIPVTVASAMTDRFVDLLQIGGTFVGEGTRCCVIAEIGVNHHGDAGLAKEMVQAAAESGADCAKFQAFDTDSCESVHALKPSYFAGSDGGLSKRDFSKSLELTEKEFQGLRAECERCEIAFLSMAADLSSLNMLLRLGVNAIKVGSSDVDNWPLLSQIGQAGLDVILSTGISTAQDVDRSYRFLTQEKGCKVILLQCTSQYPSPYGQINLMAMVNFAKQYNCSVGLSDHSSGHHVAVAAVALGAKVIEKHFTLDHGLPGVDQKASMEPESFAAMVREIRQTEQALGTGAKAIEACETEHLKTMRKSLVAACAIPAGTMLREDMLAVKRPGGGIKPWSFTEVLGKHTRVSLKYDSILKWEMLE